MRRKRGLPLLIDMDNFACHNGHKITEKLTVADIARAPHPSDSLGLSPCDFWLSGFLMDMELSTEDQIAKAKTTICQGVTSDTVQSVFQEWMQRLNWVIEDNGEYYFK
jgi:hypothetical protein